MFRRDLCLAFDPSRVHQVQPETRCDNPRHAISMTPRAQKSCRRRRAVVTRTQCKGPRMVIERICPITRLKRRLSGSCPIGDGCWTDETGFGEDDDPLTHVNGRTTAASNVWTRKTRLKSTCFAGTLKRIAASNALENGRCKFSHQRSKFTELSRRRHIVMTGLCHAELVSREWSANE
jgi:hypothetical protein